jgi:hypothetical protein
MSDLKLQKATYTVSGGQMVTELVYADHADLALAKDSVVIRMANQRVPNPNETKTARAEVLARALALLTEESRGHQ